MLRIFIILVVCGLAFGEKPEYGTAHCEAVLATDCSGYTYEPVCAYDGKQYVTYNNSCEFAHGICNHPGHSLHAVHEGPCNPSTAASTN